MDVASRFLAMIVCQSKVGKACLTDGIEKDVGGLHVTMQELVGVWVDQRTRCATQDIQPHAPRERQRLSGPTERSETALRRR